MRKIILAFILYQSAINTAVAQHPNLDSIKGVWQNMNLDDTARAYALGHNLEGYVSSQEVDSAIFYAQIQYDFAVENDLPVVEGMALRYLGICYGIKNELEKAEQYLNESITVLDQTDCIICKFGPQNNLAMFYENRGDFDRAEKLLLQNLEISESVQVEPYISVALLRLAEFYDTQKNYPKALEYCQRRLKIFQEREGKEGIAGTIVKIGTIYESQNNYPKALEYYQRGLEIYEEIGNKMQIINTLRKIGIAYYFQSNYPKALECYQRRLKIMEEIGDEKGIDLNGTLNEIGSIYAQMNNYPKALDYYQRSLKMAEENGDKSGISLGLVNIGHIYGEQGNLPKALDYNQRALKIKEEIGHNREIATVLNNIGEIYSAQNNYPKALEYCQRGLKISEESGNKYLTAIGLNNIGDVYAKQGNKPKALQYYQRSLKISEEIGYKDVMANSLYSIGDIYKNQLKYQDAIIPCQKSLELGEEVGSLVIQKYACSCLYDVYKALGKGNEALIYLEKMRTAEDSLKSEETANKLQQMEFEKVMLQDSIAKAEEARLMQEAHQAEIFQEQKSRNIALGLGLLVLLLAGGIYSRLRYVRKTKAIIEKERDRSDNLLLNILPSEIAQELKQKGRAEARDFDEVSILFTDFQSFTQTAASLSPKELVEEINICFEYFDGIMSIHGIEKIKTIGDAYMAVGGLPKPTPDSAIRTVKAALEMQRFMMNRYKKRTESGLPAFQMRVGIHTGPVVAGIVGVKKFQYDIWGDTVNTASRMESSGVVGKVNISQAIYELLKNDRQFSFESRGKIEAKGKGEMEMWFVMKRK